MAHGPDRGLDLLDPLVPTDNVGGSGMSSGSAKTEFKLDAATWTTGEGVMVDGGEWADGTACTVAAPPDGSNDRDRLVDFLSRDRAGNVKDARSCHVKIDTSPPQTADDAPLGWSSSDVAVHLSATDVGIGVRQTQFKVDGGGWQRGASVPIAAPRGGSKDGLHTIQYRSTDAADNVESIKSCTVKLGT